METIRKEKRTKRNSIESLGKEVVYLKGELQKCLAGTEIIEVKPECEPDVISFQTRLISILKGVFLPTKKWGKDHKGEGRWGYDDVFYSWKTFRDLLFRTDISAPWDSVDFRNGINCVNEICVVLQRLRAEPVNLKDAYYYEYRTLCENLLESEANHKAINALISTWKSLSIKLKRDEMDIDEIFTISTSLDTIAYCQRLWSSIDWTVEEEEEN